MNEPFFTIGIYDGNLCTRIDEEYLKKQARKKYLKRMQSELKAKLNEKKYLDRIREHVDVILHELKRCRINHPDDSWPWKSFDFVHQVAVMMEEAGEAVRAANNMREHKGGTKELYNELAQTAAMCVRCMEQLMEYSRRD